MRYLESILWIEDRNFIHQRLGLAIPIDLIQAKPNDMLSNIRAQHCHCIGSDAMTLAYQLVHRLTQEGDIGKDGDIRQQVIVFEVLAHLTSIVRRNDSSVAKRYPLGKVVK